MNNFQDRLEASLTQIDAQRPVVSPAAGAAEAVGPARIVRRMVRPVAVGIVASLAITGAVVASGVLSHPDFQPGGGIQVAGDTLVAKGTGCASGATVTSP